MKKIFIGIDFSKEKFDVTAIYAENGFTQCAESLYETFSNNKSGFKKLVSWMKRMMRLHKCEISNVLLCGENTGVYSELISDLLYEGGYTMWLESPLQIKRSMGLQRIKNDKADSAAIATYALRFQDRMVSYKPLPPALKALKELFKVRAQLVKQRTALTVRTKEKTSTDATFSQAMKLMADSSRRLVKQLKNEIKRIEKKMLQIIKENAELNDTFEILCSMKGIGLQNAAAMMVYTNNFERFDHDPRKIACYYGVAPFAHQSGTSVNGKPHTSSYADKRLKSLLSEAAKCSIRYCDEMRTYYERLIAKGKLKMVALNNVKNKLIHILVAMVKSKCKYNPNHQLQLALQYVKSSN